MTKANARSGSTEGSGIAIGIIGAIVAGALFVVLTASTGTTYHLFPLLIAFVPGGLPRVMSERSISSRDGRIAAVVGFAVVMAVWLSLIAIDSMPTTELISDQPGGVGGEFVLFGAIGALVGGWWGSRPR